LPVRQKSWKQAVLPPTALRMQRRSTSMPFSPMSTLGSERWSVFDSSGCRTVINVIRDLRAQKTGQVLPSVWAFPPGRKRLSGESVVDLKFEENET